MPTLNFPGNPTLNDIYTFNGRSWQWNGTAWQQLNAASINGLPIGNSNPSTGAFTTVSATGNITGDYFIGNGSLLTGISGGGGASIANGTSNVSIATADGNVTLAVAGTSDVAVFTSTGANVAGNVIANLFVGNGALLTNIALSSISNGTSNVSVASTNGNVSVAVAGTSVLSITAGGIINNQANGVGNIGNATGYFNTIFAKSTSAQYADLAEMYAADQHYAPGTVVRFGGQHDITLCSDADDTRVAGVISTNPSYVMNAVCSSEFAAAVALVGKVPTQVLGPVAKGDMMVPAGAGCARACNQPRLGTVIGKSLEDLSDSHGIVNIVVGRL